MYWKVINNVIGVAIGNNIDQVELENGEVINYAKQVCLANHITNLLVLKVISLPVIVYSLPLTPGGYDVPGGGSKVL